MPQIVYRQTHYIIRPELKIYSMPSSVIAWYHYDKANSSLLIAFLSGARYVYKKVPPAIYKAFRGSLSKGTYFNESIKGVFAFEKMEDPVIVRSNAPGKKKKKLKS
jgi:KTSC domain-containing protein